MSDESFDDEECTPIQEFDLQHGKYKFHLEVHEFETDSIFEIKGTISLEKEEVGNLVGYLTKRSWRNNFYTDCDAVSSEMQLISNIYFYKSGALRKEKWRELLTNEEIEKCRFGGFLFVEKVFVKKAFRGNDLGFHFLRFMFQNLKGQWNISVVKPGYYCDGEDKNSNLEIKHKNIIVLFLRLGYHELESLRKHEYFYVHPEKLTAENKDMFELADVKMPNDKGEGNTRNRTVENFLSTVEKFKNDQEKIKLLIKNFQEENVDMNLSTCGILHMAANHKSLKKLFHVMLTPEFGLDPNALSDIGDTPLHAAARDGNIKAIRMLMQQPNIDLSVKSKDGLTPYEILTNHIEGMSCFWQAMEVTLKNKDVCEDYTVALEIMPHQIKERFVEKIMSKRMFVRFKITAELQSGNMDDGMRFYNFTRGAREDIDDLAVDMHLFAISMPEEVVEGGVYKTFISGFLQILEVISYILKENKLPTESRILSRVTVCWPPSYRYYLENGGKVEYVLKGLFETMFDNSYSNGDADFDDNFGDDLEKEPEVEFFDTDFQYLNIYVLEHLLNN